MLALIGTGGGCLLSVPVLANATDSTGWFVFLMIFASAIMIAATIRAILDTHPLRALPRMTACGQTESRPADVAGPLSLRPPLC
jgi:hypothetical protein